MTHSADGSTLLRVPHASIVRRYVARGLILWLLVRLMMTAIAAFSGAVPVRDLARWSIAGALGMLGACALLGLIDVRVRGERTLLGNLGIDDRELVAMYLVPAALGELLLSIILPW